MRCVICGHQNPPGHRFCGMCARALPDPAKAAKAAAEQPPTASAPSKVEPQKAAPPHDAAPAAAVPALPKPAPRVQERPPERPRDVRYLLEDEHPHRARNRGLAVVLVLLAGLGLLIAWRTGALDEFVKWFEGGRPAVAEQPAVDTGAAPDTGAGAAAPKAAAPEETPPAQKPAAEEKAATPVPVPSTPKEVEAKPAVEKEVEKQVEAKAVPVKTASVQPTPAKVAPKPAPVIDAAAAAASECTRRLSGLRKSAGRGDAKARAALGALYAGGECVSRDLPTAYRFYAQALHADHENAQYAENLGAIWKQMSPAERQVATRSQ